MEEIIGMIIKIVVAVASLAVTALAPKLVSWIKEKIGSENLKKLNEYVAILVAAAEQMLKADDPTGEKRLNYVLEQLTNLGYTITDQIRATVEAHVFEINNKATKK